MFNHIRSKKSMIKFLFLYNAFNSDNLTNDNVNSNNYNRYSNNSYSNNSNSNNSYNNSYNNINNSIISYVSKSIENNVYVYVDSSCM